MPDEKELGQHDEVVVAFPTPDGTRRGNFTLGPRLKAGRGGRVHAVSDKFVVKLLNGKKAERVAVIKYLLGADRARWSYPGAGVRLALPHGLVEHRGETVGYVMFNLRGAYLEGDRIRSKIVRRKAGNLGWDSLVLAATTLAETVSMLHEVEIVVGDLAFENLMVDQIGRTALIDTDSFGLPKQAIPAPHFRQDVGAPEVLDGQGCSASTDRWALAVLVARLLFCGFSPFNGIPTGLLDPNDERDEATHTRKGWQWLTSDMLTRSDEIPEPAALLNRGLLRLFHRTFEAPRPSLRPGAEEWAGELQHFSHSLERCTKDKSHLSVRDRHDCAWCHVPIDADAGWGHVPETRDITRSRRRRADRGLPGYSNTHHTLD